MINKEELFNLLVYSNGNGYLIDHVREYISSEGGVFTKDRAKGMIVQKALEAYYNATAEQKATWESNPEELLRYLSLNSHRYFPINKEKLEKYRKSSSGGCYVATCVYGSYDCPEVWTLRRFRDGTLGSTWYGRAFIHTYYAVSPTLVKWFGETTWFKKMWRGTLDRMVQKLLDKGVENTPYEDKEW